MATLTINEVSKTYGSAPALTPTSFTVEAGQFVAVVGPSGCGKTTLLRVVQGLVQPTAGTVTIDGSDHRRDQADVATVFQAAALMPWYTIVRNVSFGLECHGVPRKEARERARQQISVVGLSGFEDHYPHELSGGMQQRANLARAMAVEPDILLMDEPYAALDPQTREDMQEELLRIWSTTDQTVLMITHQIDEAVFLADRVLVMSPRPGRIIADIVIDTPRPRSLEIKHTLVFQEQVNAIWRLLRAEDRPLAEPAAS